MDKNFLTKRKLTRKEFLKLGAASAGAIVPSKATVAKKAFAGEEPVQGKPVFKKGDSCKCSEIYFRKW